ncbi:hypothetical protein TWF569_006518 [Orbilia oligospora]|nr:hypothetical protein TWF569_006518 [Orbilia oligospora]KAF3152517.1 hypothetical protein TWF594_004197 [Orbilia oligospora]
MHQAIGPILLPFIFSLPFYTIAQAKVSNTPRCYYPDGRLRDSTDYQPCSNVVGQHSMCCALANRGSGADLCLPNGLCSAFTADGSQTALWRESCTDPTWESPACLKICFAKGKGYNWVKWDAPITVCRDGKICCGNKEDLGGVCCNEGKGIEIAATLQQNTAITPTATSSRPTSSDGSGFVSTATITTLITSSPRQTSTGGPDSSSIAENVTSGASAPSATPANQASSLTGMPNTAKIAIGVGIPLLVIAVVLVVFLVRRRSKRLIGNRAPPIYEKNSVGPVEIGTSQMAHELYPTTRGLYNVPAPATPKHHINIHELQ